MKRKLKYPEAMDLAQQLVTEGTKDGVATVNYSALREGLNKLYPGIVFNPNKLAGMLKRARDDAGVRAPPSIIGKTKGLVRATSVQVETTTPVVPSTPTPPTAIQPAPPASKSVGLPDPPTTTPPPPAPRPVTPAPLPRLASVLARPYGRVITCLWPIGEPGTRSFHFCDSPSEPGKPYCCEHIKLAYTPRIRRQQETDEQPNTPS